MSAHSGKVAEAMFVYLALKERWHPAVPLADDYQFDVLIEKPAGRWKRVQVKKIYTKRGHQQVTLSRRRHGKTGAKYGPDDADFLAAVDTDNHEIYLIPWKTVTDTGKFLYEVTECKISDRYAIYRYVV